MDISKQIVNKITVLLNYIYYGKSCNKQLLKFQDFKGIVVVLYGQI